MQLFQPTNITPDIRGPFGNGVQDVPLGGVTVSWQVNGTAPMTAFQIDVYRNNAESTLLYSTGKITDNCPFYGTGPDGNPVRFSYDISPSTGVSHGIVPSSVEYKLKITQWWSETDSVTQQSPSVFRLQFSPFFNITGLSHSVNSRSIQATAELRRNTPFMESSFGVLWARWVLTRQNAETGESEIVDDTGKIYGSPELSYSYDGLFSGETYDLALYGETEIGEPVSGNYADISVSYDVESTGIGFVASRACDGESAVQLAWGRLVNIPGTVTGRVGYGMKNVVMKSGSSVSWTRENNEAMSVGPPWSVIWKGTLDEENQYLCRLIFGEDDYAFLGYIASDPSLEPGTGRLYWSYNGYTLGNEFFTVKTGSQVIVVLTTGSITVRYNGNDGLFPDGNTLPDDYLFPTNGANGYVVRQKPVLREYTPVDKKTISEVEINGPQTLEYFQIVDHELTQRELYQYLSDDYTPGFDIGTRFLFDSGSSDGNAGSIGGDPTLYNNTRIYRKTGSSPNLIPVVETDLTVNTILDYGAVSQGGPYTYYLFLDSQTEGVPQARAVSNETNPCFWNWAVLSCAEDSYGNYSVNRSFLFRWNVEGGSLNNNNRPNILNNFTRYPLVQISPLNYKGGTLQSLIGVIDYSDGQNTYSDTIPLRDAIMDLSTSNAVLFLKNRKGDLWKIRPGGEITMDTMDNTREQAQSMTFPWVEVGSAENAAIYQIVS